MAYNQPFEVTAFHSCDKELALRLLNGTDELLPSNNPWDWLGPGIYFWEQNPYRALTYAEEAARQQQKFSGNIKTPFVIGAIIDRLHIEVCVRNTRMIKGYFLPRPVEEFNPYLSGPKNRRGQ